MNISELCQFLEVSRAGYYRWRDDPIGKREQEALKLDVIIRRLFAEHKERYGAERIRSCLKDQGMRVSVERVAKRMKLMNLKAQARRKYKVTTDSNHAKPISPNLLLQDFSAAGPNQKWVSDITYIRTDEGWLYLCVIIDLFSRAVIGWHMSSRMTADLVNKSLMMALFRRGFPQGVIIHTDRGSQYCSRSFQDLIKKEGLVSSMSAKGCCYDNAACESFFHSLKVELVYTLRYQTRREANASLFEYIEAYYNHKRKHSTLNYMTPMQFESTMLLSTNFCLKKAG